MTRSNGIVADGREREAKAWEREIRERVEKAHAEELNQAGWLRHLLILWRIRREIQRELEKVAPTDGLYNRVKTEFDSSSKQSPPTKCEHRSAPAHPQ